MVEEIAALAEDAAKDLGDGEDELAVWDFVADGGGDPIGRLPDAALVAGGAEVAAFAGEGEEALVTAVRAVEAEEAGGEVAAAEEVADGVGLFPPSRSVLHGQIGEELRKPRVQHPMPKGNAKRAFFTG